MSIRSDRRRARMKQLKINVKLKKKLAAGRFCAPCCYCHHIFMMINLTVEHIIPFVLGGTNDESNIALACATCNRQRGREALVTKRQMKRSHEQHTAQHQI